MRDDYYQRPGFRYHLKVHTFRTFTVVLAWVLVRRPALLQRDIEGLGDEIPSPWEPRIEFVFREIGGLIWLQITLLVVGLRVLLSLAAAIGRAISPPRQR
jgi:hypothetical protein